MKRLLFTFCLCILLIAGCGEPITPSVALLTGSNVEIEQEAIEYVGRIGANVGNTEFGLTSHWADANEWHTYGVFILQDFIIDPNALFLGNAYLGAQATIDFDNDGGLYGPIVGTRSYLGGIEILIEFQYRHYNEALASLEGENPNKYKVFVGPNFKF